MRPRLQLRLVVLMAVIATLALSLAFLKQPLPHRVSILFPLVVTILLASASLSQLAPTPEGRARWLGFSLFGWAYLLLVGSTWRDLLPTTSLAKEFVTWCTVHYGPYPTPNGRGPWYTNAIHAANGQFYSDTLKLVELYLTLIAAGIGASLTGAFAAWPGRRSTTPHRVEALWRGQSAGSETAVFEEPSDAELLPFPFEYDLHASALLD